MTNAPSQLPVSRRDFEPPYLATGVMFLFAARFPAWLIALAVVLIDSRAEPNLRYEPLILVLSLLQILVLVAYVPLVRPQLRRWSGSPLHARDDLLVLSALDMAAAFAILYFSGGIGTPYYHFAVVALLIPTFLLGWRGSIAVLAVFLVALFATWEYAGLGRDAWTARTTLGGSVPGLVLTPVLVVLVAQYLGWLARRIEAARLETAAALGRTAALYRVAQGLTQDGAIADPANVVIEALRGTGRFDELSVVTLGEVKVLATATNSVEPELLSIRLRDDRATANILAIPFGSAGADQRAIAFRGLTVEPGAPDLRLVRAAARQLTMALSRLALEEEREMLIAAEERARIAREIHDGIAQSIYMLSLQLDRLTDQASEGSELATRLRGLTALSKEALVDVRQYIFDVKPLLTGELSLAETMGRQATEFSTVAEVPVTVEVKGDEPAIPVPLRTALYRVGQEGLANAVRHAHASEIELRLEFDDERIRLEISDDGVGFDPPRRADAGHGLGNIRERIEELGGTCQVRSGPTAGTTIRVEVPVNGADEAV